MGKRRARLATTLQLLRIGRWPIGFGGEIFGGEGAQSRNFSVCDLLVSLRMVPSSFPHEIGVDRVLGSAELLLATLCLRTRELRLLISPSNQNAV